MNVIIFDLINTLIKIKNKDYTKALKWLATSYFNNRYDDLLKISLYFKKQYLCSRKSSHIEYSFIQQLHMFENALNITICDDYHAVELKFMKIFRDVQLLDGVFDLLGFLFYRGYSIFVLSNSLFSGINLGHSLNDLGVRKFIKNIYSSADIGIRKPANAAFMFVIQDNGIDNPNKVLFVGDSYEKDFLGAMNSGLTPILLAPICDVPGMTFEDARSLLNYFKKCCAE